MRRTDDKDLHALALQAPGRAFGGIVPVAVVGEDQRHFGEGRPRARRLAQGVAQQVVQRVA